MPIFPLIDSASLADDVAKLALHNAGSKAANYSKNEFAKITKAFLQAHGEAFVEGAAGINALHKNVVEQLAEKCKLHKTKPT